MPETRPSRRPVVPVCIYYLVMQFAVTIGLLIFGFTATEEGIRNVIVGAVIGHWLSEGPRMGRLVSDGIDTFRREHDQEERPTRRRSV